MFSIRKDFSTAVEHKIFSTAVEHKIFSQCEKPFFTVVENLYLFI